MLGAGLEVAGGLTVAVAVFVAGGATVDVNAGSEVLVAATGVLVGAGLAVGEESGDRMALAVGLGSREGTTVEVGGTTSTGVGLDGISGTAGDVGLSTGTKLVGLGTMIEVSVGKGLVVTLGSSEGISVGVAVGAPTGGGF